MKAICSEPREFTPEEAWKAVEAHEYYTLLDGEERRYCRRTTPEGQKPQDKSLYY
ncbi:hypothetical protein MTHERMMSTA1_13510 [Methanosarcina thermophila MST-A1]|jgi:hypothetical protein|nr:hypothetical protein MTHERMMSTA1_13510 [Methanosarcina thermophila MST-A1]